MPIPRWIHPSNVDHHVYPTKIEDDELIYEELEEELQARIDRGQILMVHTHDIRLDSTDMWDLCNDDCSIWGPIGDIDAETQ